MPDISIGKLRGKLCVYWRDPDGQRRRYQLAARTRAEAEAEGLDVYRRETWKPAVDLTITEIWKAYRTDLGDRPAGRTMDYTGKAILPYFGHYRPDQLTKDMCRAYDRHRRSKGKSQGTVHTELGHLRSALVFTLGSKAPLVWKPNKPDSSITVLNAGEIRRLIEACEMPHVRLAAILLFGTAGRVSAILDLTWDRIDFDRGIINLRIPDSVTRKGRAILPMNQMTRAALTVAAEAALTDYVIEYAGGPVKSIRTGIKAALRRAGLKDTRIHDFRHTAAVTMLGEGVPIEKVAQVLGHSNLATTFKVYGRFLPGHMQDAVNVLNFAGVHHVGS